MVEQRIRNAKVVGSSPALGTLNYEEIHMTSPISKDPRPLGHSYAKSKIQEGQAALQIVAIPINLMGEGVAWGFKKGKKGTGTILEVVCRIHPKMTELCITANTWAIPVNQTVKKTLFTINKFFTPSNELVKLYAKQLDMTEEQVIRWHQDWLTVSLSVAAPSVVSIGGKAVKLAGKGAKGVVERVRKVEIPAQEVLPVNTVSHTSALPAHQARLNFEYRKWQGPLLPSHLGIDSAKHPDINLRGYFSLEGKLAKAKISFIKNFDRGKNNIGGIPQWIKNLKAKAQEMGAKEIEIIGGLVANQKIKNQLIKRYGGKITNKGPGELGLEDITIKFALKEDPPVKTIQNNQTKKPSVEFKENSSHATSMPFSRGQGKLNNTPLLSSFMPGIISSQLKNQQPPPLSIIQHPEIPANQIAARSGGLLSSQVIQPNFAPVLSRLETPPKIRLNPAALGITIQTSLPFASISTFTVGIAGLLLYSLKDIINETIPDIFGWDNPTKTERLQTRDRVADFESLVIQFNNLVNAYQTMTSTPNQINFQLLNNQNLMEQIHSFKERGCGSKFEKPLKELESQLIWLRVYLYNKLNGFVTMLPQNTPYSYYMSVWELPAQHKYWNAKNPTKKEPLSRELADHWLTIYNCGHNNTMDAMKNFIRLSNLGQLTAETLKSFIRGIHPQATDPEIFQFCQLIQ